MKDKADLVQVIMRVPTEVRIRLRVLASMQGKSMERLMAELIEKEWEESGLEERNIGKEKEKA